MQKIMFNEQFGLQQATLDKTKDMTRRVALKDPVEDMNVGYDTKTQQCIICSGNRIVARSAYAVGEVVAIAQRYSQIAREIKYQGRHWKLEEELKDYQGWNNKMFVKAEHMLHHIKITDIKVEPLCDYPTQHLAEGELAWTSFNIPVRIATYMWNGACVCSPRSGIHPHEKPVDLYAWLLRNYAKPGDNIFDSHLDSGSSRIAAYKLGFDFVGCEIDKGYYESQEKRFQEECKDTVILPNGKQVKQLSIEL